MNKNIGAVIQIMGPVLDIRFADGQLPELLEGAGVSKFAQAVTDHIFGNEHRHVLLAVMNGEGVPNEFGEHHRAARPGLDRQFLARSVHLLHLLQEGIFNVRAFLNRTCHSGVLLSTLDDKAVAVLTAIASLAALGELAPGAARMATTRG